MSTCVTEMSQLQINSTTNQLRLGSSGGTVLTVSSTAPTASQTYTLPDAKVSCNIQLGVRPLITAASAVTLTQAQSGSVVNITTATAFDVTLPSALAGLHFKFINGVDRSGICGIVGASGTMKGFLNKSTGAGAVSSLLGGAQTRANFTATALAYDNIDVICDGTSWIVNGQSAAAAGVAFG